MMLSIFSINTGDPSEPAHVLDDGDDIRDAARGITALVSDDLVISSAALIELIDDAMAAQFGIHVPEVPSPHDSGIEIFVDGREWSVVACNADFDFIRWSATFTAVTDEDAINPDVRTLITGDRDPLAGLSNAPITSLVV